MKLASKTIAAYGADSKNNWLSELPGTGDVSCLWFLNVSLAVPGFPLAWGVGQCGAVWGMKMAPRWGKDWRMLIVWRQTGSKMLCYALYLQILWAASILPCGWAPMWVHGGRNKFCILAHTVAVVLVLWRRPAGTVVGTYLSVGSGSCHVLSAQESKTLVVSEWIKTPVAWPSHLWWFSGHWASKVPVTLEAQDTWRRQQLSDTVSAKG